MLGMLIMEKNLLKENPELCHELEHKVREYYDIDTESQKEKSE